MNARLKGTKTLATVALIGACMGAAHADVVLNLNKHVNGDQPVGGAPWLRATIKTLSIGVVQVKMENLLSSDQFVRYWNFNCEPYVPMTATYDSGPAPVSMKQGNSNQIGSSSIKGGKFDLSFEFATSSNSRFKGGMTSVVRLFGAGLTESKFNALSIQDGNVHGGYLSAAKIQGIPGGGSGSVAAVPEPSAIAAIALGALGLLRRRR